MLAKRYRVGYVSQSSLVPFTSAVADNLIDAAYAGDVDLLVLNNSYSATTALRNADRFVAEGVNLVIESQIATKIAPQLARKFSDAKIPFIAIDVPRSRSHLFWRG